MSLNDLVSDNFMRNNARGEVNLIITESANLNSVLYSTEIPTLLEMDGVLSINGIPKAELRGLSKIVLKC